MMTMTTTHAHRLVRAVFKTMVEEELTEDEVSSRELIKMLEEEEEKTGGFAVGDHVVVTKAGSHQGELTCILLGLVVRI